MENLLLPSVSATGVLQDNQPQLQTISVSFNLPQNTYTACWKSDDCVGGHRFLTPIGPTFRGFFTSPNGQIFNCSRMRTRNCKSDSSSNRQKSDSRCDTCCVLGTKKLLKVISNPNCALTIFKLCLSYD